MNWDINNIYPVAIGLIGFGVLYNQLTAWIGEKQRGFTSLLVAGGVGGTILIIIPLIGLNAAGIVLGAFVCTGLPMIIGSIARYINERQKEIRAIREQNHG